MRLTQGTIFSSIDQGKEVKRFRDRGNISIWMQLARGALVTKMTK